MVIMHKYSWLSHGQALLSQGDQHGKPHLMGVEFLDGSEWSHACCCMVLLILSDLLKQHPDMGPRTAEGASFCLSCSPATDLQLITHPCGSSYRECGGTGPQESGNALPCSGEADFGNPEA